VIASGRGRAWGVVGDGGGGGARSIFHPFLP